MTAARRMVVVGASGLVGSHLAGAAAQRGWQVTGAARDVEGYATEFIDLVDRSMVERLLGRTQPDVVVIASAWAWVDGCEKAPAKSHQENVETVADLCALLGPSPTRVVFFSTDHVFDGQREEYFEDDAPHPLSVYAQHKLEAEQVLLSRGQALVVRTSYVFGRERREKNFLYRVIDAARRKTPMLVPIAQAGAPTWAGWLAASTLELLDQRLDGVVHLVGPEVLTKAQWAARIAAGLQLGPVEVIEVPWEQTGQVAPRPARVHLGNRRHQLVHPPLMPLLEAERAGLLAPWE